MIKNLIELGKNVDVIPFAEKVNKSDEVIDIKIGLDHNNLFSIDEIELSNVNEQNIFYVKTTKTINPGKNVHFYPTDFTLGGSQIDKGNMFNYDKIKRNFNNTKEFYNELCLDEGFEQFLDNFYYFVMEEDPYFMKKVYNDKEDHIKDITKRDLQNLIFAFQFSDEIISKYNLTVKRKSRYYNLGDINEIIDLFRKFIPLEGSKKVKSTDSQCSFCESKENLYSPKLATFYYSFTFDQKTAFYNLNEDNVSKQIIICDKCFSNLNKGKKYMQSYLKNNLLGVNYFSIFEIEEENEKLSRFLNSIKNQDISSIYSSDELEEKRKHLEASLEFLMNMGAIGEGNQLPVDMFFYEYDNGYRLIKMIKDIHPSRILNLLIENENVESFSFNGYLMDLFMSNKNEKYDLLVKERINLFEKMLLEISINYDSLIGRFIKKATYKLRNQESNGYDAINFTQNHIKFLELLSRLNCELYSNKIKPTFQKKGVCIDMVNINENFEGKTGLEKMENFVSNNEFFSETIEINAGIPLGVTIARLSYNINNYEKRMLGYANKRINDKDSLKKYVNEIEQKAVMHGIANQPIVSSFFERVGYLLKKDNFSKEDFIFGMFIGYSLANKFTNPKEGEKNE